MIQPKAKRKPEVLTIHNDTRIDNYFWLKDRENPEVIAYLKSENAYRTEKMKHTVAFQEDLYKEIVARFAQTDMSVPYFYNKYWYLTRYEEGFEYPIYARKYTTLENSEEILLDVNGLAKGFSYYTVGGRSVSPDNNWMAYGVDTVSRRLFTLHFKNLVTGEYLQETIPNTSGGAVWASDNKTIFYTQKDTETLRTHRIMRHVLGTDVADDVCVYEELDETFVCGVGKTKSEKYLLIGCHSTVSNEYRFLAADNPTGDWQIFEPRQRDHEYSINHSEDTFYVITNWKAKNFRLMTATENKTEKENWQELIPHRDDVLLENFDVFKKFLVLSERIEGLTKLRIIENGQGTMDDVQGTSDKVFHRPSSIVHRPSDYYIPFDEEVYMAYTGTNPEYDTDILRIGYSSMTTPSTVYDYNMQSRTFHQLKQEAVLDDTFNPKNYISKRIYATADDRTKIPISLVYNKKLFKKNKNPLMLYAYGSYGHSIDPSFSSARLSILNRGLVFAIAHIRGGQELGRAWYEDGKLLKKKNTFTDFIACGEVLIKEGYVAKNKLCAMGGSAGGLLMGAIINTRPEMWCAIVAAVPFVDVVTTMLDETIPLTTGEFDEWGNPKNEEYYHYMKSYSPYDNVDIKKYPAMLITTGLHDSQVQYWEPAKWMAKLRELRTNKRTPLYMFCNMETGHGGASGRFERFKETAMEYAFVMDLCGAMKNEKRKTKNEK